MGKVNTSEEGGWSELFDHRNFKTFEHPKQKLIGEYDKKINLRSSF